MQSPFIKNDTLKMIFRSETKEDLLVKFYLEKRAEIYK